MKVSLSDFEFYFLNRCLEFRALSLEFTPRFYKDQSIPEGNSGGFPFSCDR